MSAPLILLANLLFLGLLYFAIFRMVRVVYREMQGHVTPSRVAPSEVAQLHIRSVGAEANHPRGTRFPLHNMTLIGRSSDNDIVLRDAFTSGTHAMIRWDGARWTVEDLGSTNGTLLNGNVLIERTPQPLLSDSVLTIGEFELEIEQ